MEAQDWVYLDRRVAMPQSGHFHFYSVWWLRPRESQLSLPRSGRLPGKLSCRGQGRPSQETCSLIICRSPESVPDGSKDDK